MTLNLLFLPVSKIEPRCSMFLSVESKDCMKSASYEYRNMLARRGEQFVPIWMPTVCWNTFPAKTTKILSTRNSSNEKGHGDATRIKIYIQVISKILLRWIHNFKSDLINIIDHMRISGNEPSSVILRQTEWFQK